jgi:hypothetical protein
MAEITLEALYEKMQAHERLDEQREAENNRRWEEASRYLRDIRDEQHAGMMEIKVELQGLSRTYSNRFWNLATGIIGTLVVAVGGLVWWAIFHG